MIGGAGADGGQGLAQTQNMSGMLERQDSDSYSWTSIFGRMGKCTLLFILVLLHALVLPPPTHTHMQIIEIVDALTSSTLSYPSFPFLSFPCSHLFSPFPTLSVITLTGSLDPSSTGVSPRPIDQSSSSSSQSGGVGAGVGSGESSPRRSSRAAGRDTT